MSGLLTTQFKEDIMNELQPTQLACNTQIDYSEIIGERILPFLMVLNLQASNLNPAPGENQRFCYNVTGVGEDGPQFADLSHLVLGICNQIPQNQIVNIVVIIDGVEQNINFGEGGNVELRTPQNPDPPTGCSGLKFDFGLDKVEGEMFFCFELTTPYPIGPNPVCLLGGGVTAGGLSICGPVCENGQTCQAVGYQPVTVCLPITVTPFVNVGTSTTFCCGNPIITRGAATCSGIENGSCSFTISQNLCVAVPVEFGTRTSVGSLFVQCGEATNEDVCTDCGTTDSIFTVSKRFLEKTQVFINKRLK